MCVGPDVLLPGANRHDHVDDIHAGVTLLPVVGPAI